MIFSKIFFFHTFLCSFLLFQNSTIQLSIPCSMALKNPSLTFFLCAFKLDFFANFLPHTSHSCGLSPVCTLRCCFKWDFDKRARLQMSHLICRSPEWIILWIWYDLRWMKPLPHKSHWNKDLTILILSLIDSLTNSLNAAL